MKMTLSMPSTISRTVRVTRAIQVSGLVSSSMRARVAGQRDVSAGTMAPAGTTITGDMPSRSLPVLDLVPPAGAAAGPRDPLRPRRTTRLAEYRPEPRALPRSTSGRSAAR